MKWDQSNYGAHTEKALTGPASNWFFAEGAQGFFLTYVLLTNPSTSPNRASVRFLRESGGPIVQEFTLAPLSRRTVDCGAIAALGNASFGIEVTFLDAPGAAERAMYFGLPPDRLFKAGHESAGVTAPSTEWFLAEGATGRFFETFVLIANPNASVANVTLTYVTETGAVVTRNKTVPGNARITVNIESEGSPALDNAAVATRVLSNIPVVVERAQDLALCPAPVVRGAQRLWRHRPRHEVGPGRRSDRAVRVGEQLHPARQQHEHRGDGDGRLHPRGRRPGDQDVHGAGQLAPECRDRAGHHGVRAERRAFRRGRHQHGADRRRAGALLEREHGVLERRHGRHGHGAAAVIQDTTPE